MQSEVLTVCKMLAVMPQRHHNKGHLSDSSPLGKCQRTTSFEATLAPVATKAMIIHTCIIPLQQTDRT